MRSLRSFVLVTAVAAASACGDGRSTSGSAPSGAGPDAVLLRMPRDGGTVQAHRAGSDSVLWESRGRSPAVASALGFDDFLGLLLAQDRQGRVVTVDLRLGTVETLGSETLAGRVVSEGSATFGTDSKGRVVRLTPAATWTWTAPGGAQTLVPNVDGSLLVLSGSELRTEVRRLIPPESRILDSAFVPRVQLAARTAAGDRLWLVTDSAIVALRARDLQRAFTTVLRDTIVAMTPTPSGDRVFFAVGDSELRVLDRYEEKFTERIKLPRPASALRMDPDGHYLLARMRDADSAYVVSIGTNRVVQTVATAWREDLPLVTPDGRVLVASGKDAALVDAETGREWMRYGGGAGDAWTLVRWNGFRPRAAGLDRPVEFEEFAQDSARTDSAVAALIAARYGDLTGLTRAAPVDAPSTDDAPERPRSERGTWNVSFATLLDETRANEMAAGIRVDGKSARVVEGNRDGVPVWRVLLGPYNSRQEAERAGMASRLSYWVFEGVP